MMINAINNPIRCFKTTFNNFELQREAELLKNRPSNVHYPNNNKNNLLISTTDYSFTNTPFISNITNNDTCIITNHISSSFQQNDYFNTLYPYCSYSPYTNDYDDDYGPILSTFSSLPNDEVMIPFNDYEFNTYPSLKRQRPYVDPPDDFAFNSNDGYFADPLNNSCCPSFHVDQFLLTSPTTNEVTIAQPAYSDCRGGGCVEMINAKESNSGYLSAQSVAARERRRKISDKTQQLGKLVPGGKKLSTAEMFHAAYKYIKFLQAQISVLEFMGSKKMDCLAPHLGVLLASPPIQEKLYAAEKCLVPSRCIEIMSKN